MKFISLFAGIGGFDLGFERAGMRCVAQVENDSFCLSILRKHWPCVPKFTDVCTFGRDSIDQPVDLIAGGFPCQPHSQAGRAFGEADDRNLWPEMFRVVQEFQPAWTVAENVPGIIVKTAYADRVLAGLETYGYTAWAIVLPACAFGLPHARERVFFVGHADGIGCQAGDVSHSQPDQALRKAASEGSWSWVLDRSRSGRLRALPDPGICRAFDGIPGRLDRYRVLGNAIVPQVAEWIGQQIIRAERHG